MVLNGTDIADITISCKIDILAGKKARVFLELVGEVDVILNDADIVKKRKQESEER